MIAIYLLTAQVLTRTSGLISAAIPLARNAPYFYSLRSTSVHTLQAAETLCDVYGFVIQI